MKFMTILALLLAILVSQRSEILGIKLVVGTIHIQQVVQINKDFLHTHTYKTALMDTGKCDYFQK